MFFNSAEEDDCEVKEFLYLFKVEYFPKWLHNSRSLRVGNVCVRLHCFFATDARASTDNSLCHHFPHARDTRVCAHDTDELRLALTLLAFVLPLVRELPAHAIAQSLCRHARTRLGICARVLVVQFQGFQAGYCCRRG